MTLNRRFEKNKPSIYTVDSDITAVLLRNEGRSNLLDHSVLYFVSKFFELQIYDMKQSSVIFHN